MPLPHVETDRCVSSYVKIRRSSLVERTDLCICTLQTKNNQKTLTYQLQHAGGSEPDAVMFNQICYRLLVLVTTRID